MATYSIAQAKDQLSKLVDEALQARPSRSPGMVTS